MNDASEYSRKNLYPLLFDDFPEAIIVSNSTDDSITDVNIRACELFGYSLEEFLTKRIKDLYPPKKTKALITPIKNNRILKTKRIFETECSHKNGTVLSLEVENQILTMGKKDFVVSVVRETSERKRREKSLRLFQSIIQSVVESPSDINIWSVDKNYRYTFFNQAHKNGMKEMWKKDISLGDSVLDHINNDRYRQFVKKSYDTVLGGEFLVETDSLTASLGEKKFFENYGSPVRDIRNEVVGATIFTIDVTEQKKTEHRLRESLREKEILLREVHHRVKNNLQIVSSLLNMQTHNPESGGAEKILLESQNRITALALIHEQLSQSENIADINLEEYIRSLSGFIRGAYTGNRKNIRIHYDIQRRTMGIDQAVPIGLIINELTTNSIKHIGSGEEERSIWIRFFTETRGEEKFLVIQVEDNGPGYPPMKEIEEIDTLGLKLVKALSEQLDGLFSWENSPGAKSTVKFPHL